MEAGIVGVFRTLLIIVVVYYAFKFLMRFLFPMILRNMARKTRSNFEKDEGKPVNKKEEKRENLGEYIDFEEIKDKSID